MTIAGWNYDRPTESALLAEFGRSMGPDMAEAIWASICRQLRLARPVEHLDDLVRATESMIEIGDLTRVAGRGAKIRVVTYRALEAPV